MHIIYIYIIEIIYYVYNQNSIYVLCFFMMIMVMQIWSKYNLKENMSHKRNSSFFGLIE